MAQAGAFTGFAVSISMKSAVMGWRKKRMDYVSNEWICGFKKLCLCKVFTMEPQLIGKTEERKVKEQHV